MAVIFRHCVCNPASVPVSKSKVRWADYVNQRICGKWHLHGSMHIPTLASVIIRVAENL